MIIYESVSSLNDIINNDIMLFPPCDWARKAMLSSSMHHHLRISKRDSWQIGIAVST